MSGENGTASQLAKASPVNGVVPPEQHRFKPGAEWRGNRTGRPKSKPITRRIRRALASAEGAELHGADKAIDTLVKLILAKARAGDFRYVKEIWDRLEGPLTTAGVTTNNYTGPTMILTNESWKRRLPQKSPSEAQQTDSSNAEPPPS